MSMTKSMTAWIRLVATEQDRQLLEQISQRNGDAGFSATVRRLIREEAHRIGIEGDGQAAHRRHAVAQQG
jgi:hypothetical protein